VADAVGSTDAKQQFMQIGVEPAHTTPEEFDRFIREQLDLHRKIVKDLGIRFD
jgi:tripartite-type tricarboxylate transporter receptor subunit TctC